ncbi:MAG: replication initiator protein A [Candidatus Sedimenticola sp. (ex Thyasira tokunagai)]
MSQKEQRKKIKERLMQSMDALERGDMGAYERHLPPLLPERHPTHDFFVCDILDAAPKDDLGSMEHPMFSLSTKPDHRIRRYEHNGNSITIAPSAHGLATIWDKDVLIYCISQVVEAMNRGRQDVGRTVWITAHDLLVATNRGVGGEHYKRLQSALERLQGTSITTDIETNGTRIKRGFSLIDSWAIVERSSTDERMVAVEISLSEWLYNAIQGNEVLTITRDYFRLRKGLERRLYELARKHCGKQPSWKIGLELLHKKSGSSGALKEFRRKIKGISKSDHLPDYKIVYYEGKDQVCFYSHSPRGNLRQIDDLLKKPQGNLF